MTFETGTACVAAPQGLNPGAPLLLGFVEGNVLAYELRPTEVPEANVEGVWVDGERDCDGGGLESLRH